jgi:hypothetical protein
MTAAARAPSRSVTLTTALADPKLLGDALPGGSWAAWRRFLDVLTGAPLDAATASFAAARTGRTSADLQACSPYSEGWIIAGRRSGKSKIAAVLACYLAAIVDWRGKLSPGEVGTVLIMAADREQAGVIFSYVRALMTGSLMLHQQVVRETQDSLYLKGNICIQVGTSSYKSVRGRTLIAAILDEVAFWSDETSANPDVEVVRALRPALETLSPHSLLIGLSSPYSKRGILFRQYQRHYGKAGSKVLIWQAPSIDMNPSLSAERIADAMADDPEAAEAEWQAEFRRDLSALFDIEAVRACVDPGVHERPFDPTYLHRYVCFVDPSGGSGSDSFTLAVAHAEISSDRMVLDCIREIRPPFNPSVVVSELAKVVQHYGIEQMTGDRYAGAWPSEQFKNHGITYVPSEMSKSELYLEMLPGINAARFRLLDLPRALGQLGGLERRTARSGRDSVDHGPGQHDDVANAVAGALVTAVEGAKVPEIRVGGRTDDPDRGYKMGDWLTGGQLRDTFGGWR